MNNNLRFNFKVYTNNNIPATLVQGKSISWDFEFGDLLADKINEQIAQNLNMKTVNLYPGKVTIRTKAIEVSIEGNASDDKTNQTFLIDDPETLRFLDINNGYIEATKEDIKMPDIESIRREILLQLDLAIGKINMEDFSIEVYDKNESYYKHGVPSQGHKI
jgi:hypothetical protein